MISSNKELKLVTIDKHINLDDLIDKYEFSNFGFSNCHFLPSPLQNIQKFTHKSKIMSYNSETILPAVMGKPISDFGDVLPTQKQIIQFWMGLVQERRDLHSLDHKKSPTKIDINKDILEAITTKITKQWERCTTSKCIISDSQIQDRLRRLLQKALAVKQFGTRSDMEKYVREERKKFEKVFDIESKSGDSVNRNLKKVS